LPLREAPWRPYCKYNRLHILVSPLIIDPDLEVRHPLNGSSEAQKEENREEMRGNFQVTENGDLAPDGRRVPFCFEGGEKPMTLREKAKLMSETDMERAIRRMAHEIIETNKGLDNVVLVGIQRRGVFLAQMIREVLRQFEQTKVPTGELDITLYRDDLTLLHDHPVVHSTSMPLDITGKRIVLIDDVIYTGRTIRAALDALMDLGRPNIVQLAVLVDRGHRELPIAPNYVGKNVPTSREEVVEVRVKEIDGVNEVVICEREEA